MSHKIHFMKKIILFPTVLAFVFAACNKNEKHTPDKPEPITEDTVKQYSYWTVNEDSFATNDVSANTYRSPGNMIAALEGGDQENSFDMTFIHMDFPQSGEFPLIDSSISYPVSGTVGIDFRYQGDYYFLARPTNNHLSASSVKGKARYTLPPTWFYSYYHPEDSVLISGTFNEP
jgi:hypothetical protein